MLTKSFIIFGIFLILKGVLLLKGTLFNTSVKATHYREL